MNKYDVFIYSADTYKQVEANSEEEAKRIALERWLYCIPLTRVYKSKMDIDIKDKE